MKKITLLFPLIVILVLAGCGAKAPTSIAASATGDPEALLKDMAAGITERLSMSEQDTTLMSDDDQIEFYGRLVRLELDRIEKYENDVFQDEKFNELAHHYINACQMQRNALVYYKNTDLYNALWTGGGTVRVGIIIAFYEMYDLPISSDEVDKYRSAGGYSVTLSNDSDTDAAAAEPVSVISTSWKNGEAPSLVGNDMSNAKVGEARVVNSPQYGYILIIDFYYTNNSSSSKNFINDMTTYTRPFQDGIALDSPGIMSESGVFDFSDAFTQIKKGGSISTQLVWVLRNNTSPIEIEFGDYKNKFIHTLILSQ